MRVILAGLFFYASVSLVAYKLLELTEHSSLIIVILTLLGIALITIVLFIVALGLFNWHRETPYPGLSIAELEGQGLLAPTDYKALRAFLIDVDEDEAPYYFVELDNKSILYLNGPFLDGTEPNDDELGVNGLCRFPCTDFTLRRHRDEGWIADIICRGDVLEPEVYGIGFSGGFDQEELFSQDGTIITDKTYDELKSLVIIEEEEYNESGSSPAMKLRHRYRLAICIAASLAAWFLFFFVRMSEGKFGNGSMITFIAATLVCQFSYNWTLRK